MKPRRVLVAGYGMAAARLAEEIRARDPGGHLVALTIAGAEPGPACNRVLLTAVLAGKMNAADTALHCQGWAREHGVDARPGVAVTAIRPGQRRAILSDGSVASYDDLVLATGSRPVLPPASGLRRPGGSHAAGVTTFRTLADCRRILATTGPGTRAAVIGGGPLGLETARALTGRGATVTVVHAAGQLMERHLDPAAAEILARRLRGMAIGIRLGARPVEWAPGAPGTLRLTDGHALRCDAVIVAAGAAPDTCLAAAAGLRTGSGVLVDDRLTTSDPAIRAIGDCAEHPAATAGLVQPAWEQAAVLADLLTGTGPDARYRGTPAVTRLRAEGIELATVGDPHAGQADGTETLRLEDRVHGRYGRLTLCGDRIASAIMIGLPDAAAAVIQLADRAAPAPPDRLALLLGRALPPAGARKACGAAVAALPGGAVLCRCNSVTKDDLVSAWRQGARSVPGLAAATRATTGCGSCDDEINGVIAWLRREEGNEVPAEEVTDEAA